MKTICFTCRHFEDIEIETKARAFRLLMVAVDDLIGPLRAVVGEFIRHSLSMEESF